MSGIRKATPADWEMFLFLADKEGWLITSAENTFLQSAGADSVLVLTEKSEFCGIVSAVAYRYSGWIGNLLVPASLRGQGYGRRLFEAATSHLINAGVSSIWLTASELGRPLYEKNGFKAIDRIERWVLTKPSRQSVPVELQHSEEQSLLIQESSAWGENRLNLLKLDSDNNMVFANNAAVALLQPGSAIQLIGPWYSPYHCLNSNQPLLQALLNAADPSVQIVTDILGSSPLRQLLATAGFNCTGETTLMAYGDTKHTELQNLVALASLGSIG